MKPKRKAKTNPKPKPIEETPTEETLEIQDIEETPEVSQQVKREKAKYMREYRTNSRENERHLLK